jgi:hypothetical protein
MSIEVVGPHGSAEPFRPDPGGLWVDDSKPVPDGVGAVARTYDDALRLCRRFRYSSLYLDHDLGEERTGLDLLRQLKSEECCPPTVVCISWNPAGRRAIEAEIAAPAPPAS